MDERDDEFEPEAKTSKYPAPFSVRLSAEEREELEKLAPDQPWGQYIKDVIFREKRKPRVGTAQKIKDHKILARLLGLLGQSRISQNINQLAKAANSGSLPVTPDVHKALLEAARSVQHMRALLIEAMGLKAQSDDPKGEPQAESEEP